jgi:hypothetical protein
MVVHWSGSLEHPSKKRAVLACAGDFGYLFSTVPPSGEGSVDSQLHGESIT